MNASEHIHNLKKIASSLDRLGYLYQEEREYLEDAKTVCIKEGCASIPHKVSPELSLSVLHSKKCEHCRSYAKYVLEQSKAIEAWKVVDLFSHTEEISFNTSKLDTFKF
jgi:hypothetical protein